MTDAASKFLSVIPAWVAATTEVDVPNPIGVAQLKHRVAALRDGLREGLVDSANAAVDAEGLAVLSQLCFQLSQATDVDQEKRFQEAASAYDLIRSLAFAADEFDERAELLSEFAVTAWRAARYVATPAVVHEWEGKSQSALSAPSAARERLDSVLVSLTEGSEVEAAFLSSQSTLFALCASLRAQRNSAPSKVVEGARRVYELQSTRSGVQTEESIFVRAETCLLAGICSRLLGHFSDSKEWLSRARVLFMRTATAPVGLARVEFAALALSYEWHRFDVVVEDVAAVAAKFRGFGMDHEACLCLYLRAAALEQGGHTDEAIEELLPLRGSAGVARSSSLARFVDMKLGEMLAQKGQYQEAFRYYQEASDGMDTGDWSWEAPNVRASLAVTLRDIGNLGLAIEVMREAVAGFDRSSVVARAAYCRVLLAEMLLGSGRIQEAEIEILAALPTIEKQSMVSEGLAAGKLLREALRRCGADRAALLRLCVYLKSQV